MHFYISLQFCGRYTIIKVLFWRIWRASLVCLQRHGKLCTEIGATIRFKLISNRVLSFKETEIAKSVYVRAIPDRRFGTRRYDIEFPNVLITVFLFLLRFPFTLPSEHGVGVGESSLAERSYHRRKLRATDGWRRLGKGLEAPSGG